MHETESSRPVHWDYPLGWDGEGGGMEVQDSEYMYTHGWFMSMYGKNDYNIVIILQLKEINLKKKPRIKVLKLIF